MEMQGLIWTDVGQTCFQGTPATKEIYCAQCACEESQRKSSVRMWGVTAAAAPVVQWQWPVSESLDSRFVKKRKLPICRQLSPVAFREALCKKNACSNSHCLNFHSQSENRCFKEFTHFQGWVKVQRISIGGTLGSGSGQLLSAEEEEGEEGYIPIAFTEPV